MGSLRVQFKRLQKVGRRLTDASPKVFPILPRKTLRERGRVENALCDGIRIEAGILLTANQLQ